MPDADDFDVEELRSLLRGEGCPPRGKTSESASRAPAVPPASKKSARPAAKAKSRGKAGKGPTKR